MASSVSSISSSSIASTRYTDGRCRLTQRSSNATSSGGNIARRDSRKPSSPPRSNSATSSATRWAFSTGLEATGRSSTSAMGPNRSRWVRALSSSHMTRTSAGSTFLPWWHCLNFRPEPHGHGSLRPTDGVAARFRFRMTCSSGSSGIRMRCSRLRASRDLPRSSRKRIRPSIAGYQSGAARAAASTSASAAAPSPARSAARERRVSRTPATVPLGRSNASKNPTRCCPCGSTRTSSASRQSAVSGDRCRRESTSGSGLSDGSSRQSENASSNPVSEREFRSSRWLACLVATATICSIAA